MSKATVLKRAGGVDFRAAGASGFHPMSRVQVHSPESARCVRSAVVMRGFAARKHLIDEVQRLV